MRDESFPVTFKWVQGGKNCSHAGRVGPYVKIPRVGETVVTPSGYYGTVTDVLYDFTQPVQSIRITLE